MTTSLNSVAVAVAVAVAGFFPARSATATATFTATFPAYLRGLPWACDHGGESTMQGARFETLSVCRPNGAPKIEPFVQAVANAMGNAGHPPRLRFGPLGPHLYAIDGPRVVSATFVRDTASKRFDVWISVQEAQPATALPELPQGAEWITAHKEQTGQRLLALRLDAGVRDSGALLAATFNALGATPVSANDAKEAALPTRRGRIAWGDEVGFFHLTEIDPHASYLTIYTGHK